MNEKPSLKQLLPSSLRALVMKAFLELHATPIEDQPYLGALTHALENVAHKVTKRLLVALPPRHLKTFVLACLITWILAKDPRAKILVISYSQELAKELGKIVRDILLHEFYQETFSTRFASHRVHDLRTTLGGVVRSTSLESGLTGFGANYIFIDDILQIKEWDDEPQKDRIYQIFLNEIRTRLNNPKDDCIVIVGHRLHNDDLIGRLQQVGDWKELTLPLVAPRSANYELGNGKVWKRKRGDILRPDQFTQQTIQELQNSDAPDFETLWQQNPGARDFVVIHERDFRRYRSLP